ncbi:MAG: Hsp20/alpha crystallin family protein [Deltaproteobacteria bacterium]|nr:Hsp20/alpha crystallin family protein [Deltaproteobacteria bacterium]
MAIIRWTPGSFGLRSPWSEFDRLRQEVSRLFDTAVGTGEGRGPAGAGVFPHLNLSEDQDNLYLTAELPGVTAENLELTVHNDQLTVRGERKIAEADKTVNYHRREREAGFFRRVIKLPVRVDADKITAVTKEGVLQVTLPKAVEAKPRQIVVKSPQ